MLVLCFQRHGRAHVLFKRESHMTTVPHDSGESHLVRSDILTNLHSASSVPLKSRALHPSPTSPPRDFTRQQQAVFQRTRAPLKGFLINTCLWEYPIHKMMKILECILTAMEFYFLCTEGKQIWLVHSFKVYWALTHYVPGTVLGKWGENAQSHTWTPAGAGWGLGSVMY